MELGRRKWGRWEVKICRHLARGMTGIMFCVKMKATEGFGARSHSLTDILNIFLCLLCGGYSTWGQERKPEACNNVNTPAWERFKLSLCILYTADNMIQL